MVEVGSISIGGNIETSEIERGLGRVEKGFAHIEAKGKGVNADFERLFLQSKRLVTSLGAMAIVGAGAMVALAKGAPATAGAMAKLKVSAGKLMRTLGEALAPAFDLVSEAFNKFVGWIDEHKGAISWFTTTTLGGLLDAIEGIKKGWNWITDNIKDISAKIGLKLDLGDKLNWLWEHFGPEVVGGLIGAWVGAKIGGPTGALIGGLGGAGLTYTGRRIENPRLTMDESLVVGGILSLLSGFTRNQLNRLLDPSLI